MDFDEHEDQEEENDEMDMEAADAAGLGNSGVSSGAPVSVGPTIRTGGVLGVGVKYKECLKNHAAGIGGHAVDGCCEFMAAGEDGTLDALKCAACNCHRNFHRKESIGGHILPPPPHHSSGGHFAGYSFRSPHPAGYLHVNNPPRPLALPSTSREDEDMSNPSSSGGGGGGGGGGGFGSVGGGTNKKRFRTKFTQEQKDKMMAFAEKLGWRIQKQDEAAVQQFCAESNVRRHVFKVWMHNNKQTLGKKP